MTQWGTHRLLHSPRHPIIDFLLVSEGAKLFFTPKRALGLPPTRGKGYIRKAHPPFSPTGTSPAPPPHPSIVVIQFFFFGRHRAKLSVRNSCFGESHPLLPPLYRLFIDFDFAGVRPQVHNLVPTLLREHRYLSITYPGYSFLACEIGRRPTFFYYPMCSTASLLMCELLVSGIRRTRSVYTLLSLL